MANTIKIKKSSVTGVIPTGLVLGELAINIKDKKLFYLNDLGILQIFDLNQDPSELIQKQTISTNNQTNLVNLIRNTWL